MRIAAALLSLLIAAPAPAQEAAPPASMPMVPPWLLRESMAEDVEDRISQGIDVLDQNPLLPPAWTVPPTAPPPPTVRNPEPRSLDGRSIEQRIEKGLTSAGEAPTVSPDYAYGAFQRGYFLTAFAIALERARGGDAAAQTLLGMLLSRGLGVKQDFKEAAHWYEIAARNGDAEARYALGRFYLEGLGVPKDAAKAADYFEQAGEAGHSVAWRELAYLLLQGNGRPQNALLAAAYLRRAARSGDMDAQFALAGLYVEGVGVVDNPAEAARWYGEAARNGHVGAQVEYAILLFNGRGVPKDEETAARWLQQAANSDNPLAQTRLARLYAEGRGVKADVAQAARWYQIAKRKGFADEFMESWMLRQSESTRIAAEKAAERWQASTLASPPSAAPTSGTDSSMDDPDLLPAEQPPETTGAID